MPHLLIRGVPAERLCTVSIPLLEELAVLCGCGTDNFTLECLHTTAVAGGQIVPSFPFVEVGWFERGPAVRDLFAQTVTRHLLSLGYPEVETAFTAYREEDYYINGVPCSR
ncbi:MULTISPECIES: DUF1904 family protein [Paenibacillus]|uniref:DUF1904 family protein n=1 Tax=Paenibacillus TaxID=44249 RepID=UPI0022B8FC78|nr:DUF1904 family protein [Paenibacillus caseinilyticus]MCZ8523966.1 DUF1904 family protein [Paenibacillus caseinilyticus]